MIDTQVNASSTVQEQFEALKLQLLEPLRQERKSLLSKLAKVEKQMTKIDVNSVNDGGMPTRIDHASRAVLRDADDGLTLDELQKALQEHKAIDKLEASLEKDSKVELREGKYFLKAA
jgi:hypothetical protein